MIIIRIGTVNAAFDGPAKYHEIARILRRLAIIAESEGSLNCEMNDVNGNKVAKMREVRDANVKEIAY